MNGTTDSRFGPPLPALLRGLWRRSGAAVRLGLGAIAVLLVAAVVYPVARWLDRPTFSYDGPLAPAFSVGHGGLDEVEPGPGEIARFEDRRGGRLEQALAISPLRFPPARNPVATTLPLAADRLAAREATRFDGYSEALEGRTKLGIMDGRDAYMVAFTARAPDDGAAGSRLLGKLLLVPGPGERPRAGVVIELLQVSDDERVLAAARRYPSAFFLNWPANFWLDLAVSVRVPGPLGGALDSFAFT